MTRAPWSAGLLCAGLLVAGCGDDDELDQPVDAGSNVGTDAGAGDAQTPAVVRVDNAGAACAEAPSACTGGNAICQRAFGEPPLSVELPGGYCTAPCASSSQCGSGGGCPLGDLSADIPGLGDIITSVAPLTSTCWDKCSTSTDPCRAGYVCRSIRDLIPADLRGGLVSVILFRSAAITPYCMPPFDLTALFDGGVPRVDAGVVALPLTGGMDAGT